MSSTKKSDTDLACDDTVPAQRVVACSDESTNLVSSAPGEGVFVSESTADVTLSGERVSELLAREFIVQRMADYGIALEADVAYSCGELLVRLDGFNEHRKIRYQFVSHAGDDVVTDFDRDVEERLGELGAMGVVQILVIHDHHARDREAILERVEAFLQALPIY